MMDGRRASARCATAQPRRASYRAAATVLLVATTLAGCDGRRTVTADTSRTAVTVRVRAPAALAAFAAALHWPADAVPGATVVVTGASTGTAVADAR